ncbi:intradiol ring-cleavage dioxygenase [Fulvivirga ulvae]|uniref:dioxygenase family protein n=1 Tax=Fulvivirga ulvae TaxID=2904245 RepID=UPI001F2BD835|nr:intradiol ring-cleavage dioxygenase [Fulvivirga ulvae]UII31056.1 intradiol ring-cleavage dioxygenase [Fulvivirga ulvae]
MERKEFLKTLSLGSMALPLLIRCNGDDDGVTPTSTTDDVTSEDTAADCIETASETAGPFPSKDPASLQRLDIRGDRTGILMDIEITVLDQSNSCIPLEGAIVDIWHCDKDGYYSEYGGTGMQSADFTSQHFLRGRQIADANGKVAFTSIFPGWYTGRSTHIHVHVYDADGNSLLVTQIAFPEGSSSAVNQVNAASDAGYTKGMSGYTTNSTDNVFSDGVSTELANISGDVSSGFYLTHSIVV